MTRDFLGHEWTYDCMGCAIADGSMLPPGGFIKQTEHFVVHQDPLIPLPGFLAFLFLLSGILSRRYGLLIPGGILAGLGAGTLLVEGPFKYLGDGQASSGVFFLAFAAGWVLITLAALLIQRVILWPLIPGAFLGLFGIVLLAGQTGMRALELFGQGWPIILIVIGLYLVLRRRELTK